MRDRLALLEKVVADLPSAKLKLNELNNVCVYPKEVSMATFNWNASDFTCPVCYTLKVNKTFGVFKICYHTVCDACLRRSDSRKCPLCNIPAALLRDSEPLPESSNVTMESEEEEIKFDENGKPSFPAKPTISLEDASRLTKEQLIAILCGQGSQGTGLTNSMSKMNLSDH